MKKLLIALIVLCCFSLPGAAQQEPAAATDDSASHPVSSPQEDPAAESDSVVEEIVARINNSIITRDQLRRNRAQTEMDAREMNLQPAEVAERKQNALRDLIDQQLLIQKAAELGISADADLIQRLDDLRKQMKVDSIEELQKLAESQGVSWEEFKQNSKNGILAQKVIGSEVGGRIQITQQDVQRYYDAHKEEYSQDARVRLSEILIDPNSGAVGGELIDPTDAQIAAAREKVLKIYDELKAGGDFAEIARKQSNGSTAAQGGDLGYFKHNDLAAQLEELTFHLKIGEFTQPIRTRQGFIILTVTDRIAEGAPSLDQLRGRIQDQIYAERIQPALRAYLVKLRQEAYIDVRPGYTDTGAVLPESEMVFTTDSGPKTKEVRGPLGLGKKTVLVDEEELDAALGAESKEKAKSESKSGTKSETAKSTNSPYGIVSELDASKAKLVAAERQMEESKTPEQIAAAKAAHDEAEQEMLSHMSSREKKQYFKDKEKNAKKRAEHRKDQKELAEQKAQMRAAKSKLVAAQESLDAAKTEQEKDAAKDAVKTAEKEMLSHMSQSERSRYLRQKQKAERLAQREREEAKRAAAKEHKEQEQKELKEAKQNKPSSDAASEKADASSAATKKKKGFSWF